jgi:hypothetical protein
MHYSCTYNLPFGTINIYYSKEFKFHVLGKANYTTKFSNKNVIYNVFFNEVSDIKDDSYRAKQMRKGVYLGHNIGKPCCFSYKDNNFYIFSNDFLISDYEKVFWNFILKFILTKESINNSGLHLKGTLIQTPNNKNCLLLGKGESGKTTIAKELENNNFKILSNTHCLMKGKYFWGINSWTRIRNKNDEKFYLPVTIPTLEGILDKVYIIQSNNKSENQIKNLNDIQSYTYTKYFSSAIINYDLKEEIYDYCSKNLFEFSNIMETDAKLLKEFCSMLPIKYANIDILNSESKNAFIKELIK